MLLIHALLRSRHGIATRQREIRTNRRTKIGYHMAVVSDKGIVHILNSRNGTIRRIGREDQMQDDWTPFQEVEPHSRWLGRLMKAQEELLHELLMPKPKPPKEKKKMGRPRKPLVLGPKRPKGRPRKATMEPSAPVVIEGKSDDVCASCELPSPVKFFIGAEEWECEECYRASRSASTSSVD